MRERAALFLESQPGSVPATAIARELLGIRGGTEGACEALLRPILAADPRFVADGTRWRLGEAPPRPAPPRDWPWAVWAFEPGLRAAAVVRLDGGRTVAERSEEIAGSAEDGGSRRARDRSAASAATLPAAALRRLAAAAGGSTGVSAEPASAPFLARALLAAGALPERGVVIPLHRFASAVLSEEPLPRGLAALAYALGADPSSLDRPVDRARVGAECLLRLLELRPLSGARSPEDLDEVVRAPRAKAGLAGRGFDHADLAALPDRPGTYRFLDAAGGLLYVGKARNLRVRVGSYFAARRRPDPRTALWLPRVHSFAIEETGSELEALLREAEGIALARPRFNVQRHVHPRRRSAPGSLVLILPVPGGSGARACLVRDGSVEARVALGPGRRGRARLGRLLREFYFQPSPPFREAENPARARRRARAGALIASWLASRKGPVPAFDPTDAADARSALAIALAYARSLAGGETEVVHR